MLVYISKDDKISRRTCQAFRVGAQACDVHKAIVDALALKAKKDQAAALNVFAALPGTKETVIGSFAALEMDRSRLMAGRVVGMGQFGAVHLALEATKDGSTIHRAVKLMRHASTAEDKTQFLHEAEVMLAFDHSNVLKVTGVCVA